MSKTFFLALSTLIGATIGAGIFGFPYVVAKSGLVPGIIYFFLLGGVVLLLHLFFGEICLRTSGKYRLVGYAKIYLGKWGKLLATFVLFFVLAGALLSYLILAGSFFDIVFSPWIHFPSTIVWSVLFWIAGSFFILKGRQLITVAELFMNVGFFAAIGVLFLFAIPHMQSLQIPSFDIAGLPIAFGVFLFGFLGLEAIPELASFLKDTKEKMRLHSVIIWGSVGSGLLFALFSFLIVGVSGTDTTEDALSGLVPVLGREIVLLGALFGILAISSSFLVLGNYLKNSLRHDFGIPDMPAFFIACSLPLILFLMGFRQFIEVIGVVGGIAGAAEGALIVLIFLKAKKLGDRTPEYDMKIPSFVLFLIVLILAAGAAQLIFD
ncbi:MAG: hypothetical protein HYS60_02155 [Candidatus Wildermuthbacteria bacterium]|nr:hypothetical protein [Candidatus Wildermuthbacteria bacterium]